MAGKCVHKGCGKAFTDPEEPCVYHPGPPVFHEGQKGWACCKPRVLTFDEFLSIPPCTTGQHSTVDDTQPTKPKETPAVQESDRHSTQTPASHPIAPPPQVNRVSQAPQAIPSSGTIDKPPEESDSDDLDSPIPPNTTCKRRGCNATSKDLDRTARHDEKCMHHPGQPIFHEGTKGWTCCKKRVLEFDEFLNIEGCKIKTKHLFTGKKKASDKEEVLTTLRHDYYQTSSTVIASLFLKKIDKQRSAVNFISPSVIELDLHTHDHKHYAAQFPLCGTIDPSKSSHKIMGTKLELSLVKVDNKRWATLRSDEPGPNEIIQGSNATKA